MDVSICDIADPTAISQYGLSGEDELRDTADEVRSLGRECEAFIADVRDPNSVENAVAATVEKFGTLDFTCANAGVALLARSWEMTYENWETVIGVNLTGAWVVASLSARQMIKQQSGSIVFVSSAQTNRPKPGASAYNASKSGLIGLMKTMAVELRPFHVRVNAVVPGRISTGMQRVNATSLSIETAAPDTTRGDAASYLMPAEAVADAILWFASPASRPVTGSALLVDDGYSLDWRKWPADE